VPTLRLCVLYGSQNKQQLLPYKTLRDWFLNRNGEFTARYALSPYIKQIRFVFKGLTYLYINKTNRIFRLLQETRNLQRDINRDKL
jgi:hypothetical protein